MPGSVEKFLQLLEKVEPADHNMCCCALVLQYLTTTKNKTLLDLYKVSLICGLVFKCGWMLHFICKIFACLWGKGSCFDDQKFMTGLKIYYGIYTVKIDL